MRCAVMFTKAMTMIITACCLGHHLLTQGIDTVTDRVMATISRQASLEEINLRGWVLATVSCPLHALVPCSVARCDSMFACTKCGSGPPGPSDGGVAGRAGVFVCSWGWKRAWCLCHM